MNFTTTNTRTCLIMLTCDFSCLLIVLRCLKSLNRLVCRNKYGNFMFHGFHADTCVVFGMDHPTHLWMYRIGVSTNLISQQRNLEMVQFIQIHSLNNRARLGTSHSLFELHVSNKQTIRKKVSSMYVLDVKFSCALAFFWRHFSRLPAGAFQGLPGVHVYRARQIRCSDRASRRRSVRCVPDLFKQPYRSCFPFQNIL